MIADLNKRYIDHLWRCSRYWPGPTVTRWFLIGPALLLTAVGVFSWLGEAEMAWIAALLLAMVALLGWEMWRMDGVFRLLNEKEAEIERLKSAKPS